MQNGDINEKTLQAAKTAGFVTLQTDLPEAFKRHDIGYTTLDDLYDDSSNFDELTEKSFTEAFS